MTAGWYDFSNVKSSKMLSFYPVAEAQGLICPGPSGENVRFALLPMRSVVEFAGFQGFEGVDTTKLVCTRKSFKFLFLFRAKTRGWCHNQ